MDCRFIRLLCSNYFLLSYSLMMNVSKFEVIGPRGTWKILVLTGEWYILIGDWGKRRKDWYPFMKVVLLSTNTWIKDYFSSLLARAEGRARFPSSIRYMSKFNINGELYPLKHSFRSWKPVASRPYSAC